MGEFYQDNYHNGRQVPPPARLWPWVMVGLIVAMSVRYVLG
jgi:hypothetical protein